MPYARIDGVWGRIEEEITLPAAAGDAREIRVHPNVFHAVMDTQPVKQWQIIQEAARIRVLVRPEPPRFNAAHLVDALA